MIEKDYIQLNVGDFVLIDEPQNVDCESVPYRYIHGMWEYSGMIAIITQVNRSYNHTQTIYKINIDGDCNNWSIDMFKYVAENGSNKLIKVKKRPDLY